MALAVGTAQYWHAAFPPCPALALLSGLLLGCHANKATCPNPAHPLAQQWGGWQGWDIPTFAWGNNTPWHSHSTPGHGCIKAGAWGCKAMVWGHSQWWQGAWRHAQENMDTPLDGPSQCGHMGRDKQMYSWMLRLAVPPTIPSVP